jgi:hypothetical protein
MNARSGHEPLAHYGRRAALIIVLCASAAGTANGQTNPPSEPQPKETPAPFNIAPPARGARPSRALFGMPQPDREPTLVFEGLFGGGASANPLATRNIGAPGVPGASGTGAGTGSANLTYSRTEERFGINAKNLVLADYYGDLPGYNLQPRDVASAAIYMVPFQPTRITVTENFKNVPEFSLADLNPEELGDAIPSHQDFATVANRYSRYGTTVDVGQALSARSRVDMSAGYAHGVITAQSFSTVLLTGRVRHWLTRGVALYVQYQYGGKLYDQRAGATHGREIHPRLDGGVDYNHALSFARRTILSFSTGVAGTQDPGEQTTTYHLIGSAHLTREFGRTWSAGSFYGRKVEYLDVLTEALFSDSLGGVLDGSLNNRVQLKSIVGASSGRRSSSSDNFRTYFANVQLSLGITRHLAFGADYSYARLSAPAGALPLDLIAGQLVRNGVHVYVKVWRPLLSRPRKS